MIRQVNPNLEIVEMAASRLGALREETVFVGGCATGLLLTDAAAPPIRATRDVDVIVEVASLASYQRLSARLRDCGFREDQSDDAPICRWISGDLILDLMPTKTELLGFGNDWYAPAFHTANLIELPSGMEIRLIQSPYFLATKLAAFFKTNVDSHILREGANSPDLLWGGVRHMRNRAGFSSNLINFWPDRHMPGTANLAGRPFETLWSSRGS